jgi:hypothetical protein
MSFPKSSRRQALTISARQERIQAAMQECHGFVWGVQSGFHLEESMQCVINLTNRIPYSNDRTDEFTCTFYLLISYLLISITGSKQCPAHIASDSTEPVT